VFDPYDAGKLAEDAILSHSRVLEVGGSVERKPYAPPLLLSGNGDPADAAISLASVVAMATAPFTDATDTSTSTLQSGRRCQSHLRAA
jgi:hypothetical protein